MASRHIRKVGRTDEQKIRKNRYLCYDSYIDWHRIIDKVIDFKAFFLVGKPVFDVIIKYKP